MPALIEAGVAFAAAALILTICYFFTFRWANPEFVPFMDRGATQLIVPGKELIPVSGGGLRIEGDKFVVQDFNDGEAVLALTTEFQAEDYPFIRVNLKGLTRFSKAKILWRQTHNLSEIHSLEFNRSADEVTQIAMVYGNNNYRGRIADIALLFYDGPALGVENNNDVEIVVESIELRPFSVWNVAEQIFEDWTNPPIGRASANNTAVGVHSNGLLLPNMVANLLIAIGFILGLTRRTLGRRRHSPQLSTPAVGLVLGLCFYGWVFVESLRWHWRAELALDATARFSGLAFEERIQNDPVRCSRFPRDCNSNFKPYF